MTTLLHRSCGRRRRRSSRCTASLATAEEKRDAATEEQTFAQAADCAAARRAARDTHHRVIDREVRHDPELVPDASCIAGFGTSPEHEATGRLAATAELEDATPDDSYLELAGTIYAPPAEVKVNGSSPDLCPGSVEAQLIMDAIIAYEFHVTGAECSTIEALNRVENRWKAFGAGLVE